MEGASLKLYSRQSSVMIESILKIDPCYSADHESSFRFNKNKAYTIHSTSSLNTRSRQNNSLCTRNFLPYQKLVPNFSERYSISNIMKHLKITLDISGEVASMSQVSLAFIKNIRNPS